MRTQTHTHTRTCEQLLLRSVTYYKYINIFKYIHTPRTNAVRTNTGDAHTLAYDYRSIIYLGINFDVDVF